ncbi:hypothetical protein ACHAWU_001863 [Discostella pseudostelligera]|uniref:Thioredoxin domain-containing protein n=1 Tax=Discostella pseudostelligera TaxID=259834 RepID=A0ABD3M9T3_9STRA
MAMATAILRRMPSFRRNALLQHLPKVSSSQPRRWMSVISLSDSDAVDKFRTIHSKSVMYFTASWCPPCKMIAPIYEDLSKQYPDVAFGKIDVDNNQDSAAEFHISAVPTFVFSKGKEAVNKFSGADKVQLEKLVKDL